MCNGFPVHCAAKFLAKICNCGIVIFACLCASKYFREALMGRRMRRDFIALRFVVALFCHYFPQLGGRNSSLNFVHFA